MATAQPCAALTEHEYWRVYHLIRGDVEAAIKSNAAYLKIHNLAVAERPIWDKLNHFPEFWTLNAYALQTTFFIVFGRLFDTRADSHSVQKLVDATIANPCFFSRAALRERKRESVRMQGLDQQWLTEYIQAAWEPNQADLEPLRAALTPHVDKFKAIYRPLRHKYFAHKSIESDAAIAALFGQTLIGDVTEILRFLHTLLYAIREMAWNATRPDLTNFNDYNAYVTKINTDTERFVRQLP